MARRSTLESTRLLTAVAFAAIGLMGCSGKDKPPASDDKDKKTPASRPVRLVAFDEEGRPSSGEGIDQLDDIIKEYSSEPPTDIHILVHGWKTGSPDATRDTVQPMKDITSSVANDWKLRPEGYRSVVLAVHWPSLYYSEIEKDRPTPESPKNVRDREALRYWNIQKRAALVGSAGVRELIVKFRSEFPKAKVHLIGYSMGCTVLLSALTSPGAPTGIRDLLLIQGAVPAGSFRQNGQYAKAKDAVEGAIVVTFSDNDRELKLWYPLASALQPALGGIGAQGAEAVKCPKEGEDFTPKKGINNVDATEFITSHTEWKNRHIGWLVRKVVHHDLR